MANLHGGVQTTVTTINYSSFLVDVINIPIFGTPVNLPNYPIPDGVGVVFRSIQGNGAKRVYLANSSANTADATKRIELRAGESLLLYIINTNVVWIDSSGNNAKLEIITEQ